MDIESIIIKIKSGDSDKFEEVVNSYQQKIFDYCWYMLGNHQEAEDTVQDVFIKIYSQLNKYIPNTNFNAWVYRIAYNQCIDTIRRRKRAVIFQYFEDMINKESLPAIDKITIEHPIHEALSRLSISDRNIILLKALDKKTYEEISHILNKNSTSLRKQYERAIKKLRKILKEEEYNEQLLQF